MTKACNTCGDVKLLDEFFRQSDMPDERRPYCKKCDNARRRSYPLTQEQRRRYNHSAIARKHVIKRLVWQFLQNHPCVDCGEADPVVLEFDHVRGKKLECISVLAGRGTKWPVIQAEIEKCDVRCANCHVRKTANELGHFGYLRTEAS